MAIRGETDEPRMTLQTLGILAAIVTDPTRKWYGLELAAASGVKSGTLYPALARLERADLLQSSWEEVDPKAAGRPRRRLYELSDSGRERARVLLDTHVARLGGNPARSQLRTKPKPKPKPGVQPA